MDDDIYEIAQNIIDQAMQVKTKYVLAMALVQVDVDNFPYHLRLAGLITTLINTRMSQLEYDYTFGEPMQLPCDGCGGDHAKSRDDLVKFISDAALMLSAVIKNDHDTADALAQLFEAEKGL